jgi:hypothetical protein
VIYTTNGTVFEHVLECKNPARPYTPEYAKELLRRQHDIAPKSISLLIRIFRCQKCGARLETGEFRYCVKCYERGTGLRIQT